MMVQTNEKIDSLSISVGDHFKILSADVLSLTDDREVYAKPRDLARALFDAYINKLENEIPPIGNYIRFGYQEIRLNLLFDNGLESVLSFRQTESIEWPRIGGPTITGEFSFIMPGITGFKCRTQYFNHGNTTGDKFAKFFARIGKNPIIGFFLQKLGQPGSAGHDDYVALVLRRSSEEILAEGEIAIFHHTGIGDTYNMLYNWQYPERIYRP